MARPIPARSTNSGAIGCPATQVEDRMSPDGFAIGQSGDDQAVKDCAARASPVVQAHLDKLSRMKP